MGESIEHAREAMERAHEAHTEHGDTAARWVAVLVALFATALALADVGEKASQTAFLMNHISVSDDYAYYQAKNQRVTTLESLIAVLENLPAAAGATTATAPTAPTTAPTPTATTGPTVAARIAEARKTQAQLQDDAASGKGMKQLLAQAAQHERAAEHALHRQHAFAGVAGALQISILLASVSIVTRARALTWGAGVLGGLAIAAGLLTVAGLV